MSNQRRPISVVLATYNGERFIAEQLASILSECGSDDEVLVVDDGSCDATLAIVEGFRDVRVRVERNSRNLGPQRTFGRALGMARYDTIFMSDQDDVWIPGRVAAMLRALDAMHADVVASNSEYVDAARRPIPFPMPPLRENQSANRLGNLRRIFAGRAGYYGCAMALRADLLRLVLPIPWFMESHDLWISLVANTLGRMVHLEDATLERRIHGSNVSVVSRPIALRLMARVRFTAAVALAISRRLRRGTLPANSVGQRA